MFATGGRRYLVAGVLLIALGIVAAQAGIQVKKTWVVELLELPKGYDGGIANDINDSELIGGGLRNEDDKALRPAYWKKGKPYEVIKTIGVPDDYDDAYGIVQSVNNKGQLVGAIWHGGSGQVAMKWDTVKGTFQNLHPGGDYFASGAWGINARGDVCGVLFEPDSTYGYHSAPYVWSHDGKSDTELTRGGFDRGWALGINASGVVAGYGYSIPPSGNLKVHAVFWDKKGKMTDLFDEIEEAIEKEFDGQGLTQCLALDVHENGKVVGQAWFVGTDETWPWSWTEKDGVTILDMGKDKNGGAWKAVGTGIVGSIKNFTDEQNAAVWVKGVLDVIPDPTGYGYSESSSLNGHGAVVGYAAKDQDLNPRVPWIAKKK